MRKPMSAFFRRMHNDVSMMPHKIIENRFLCIICFLSVFLLLLTTKTGYIFWSCPFHSLFHLPCPGCGMTRAALAIFQGDLAGVLRWHPFTPYFILLGFLCSPGIALSAAQQKRWAGLLTKVERRTALNTIILISFVAYSFLRLLWVIFREVQTL